MPPKVRQVSEGRKQEILRRHARNEPLAVADPVKFLTERGLPVPDDRADQEAAVRALFADMRKAHGVE